VQKGASPQLLLPVLPTLSWSRVVGLSLSLERSLPVLQVIVSGKLRAQRAKSMKFKDGYMISSGGPTKDYIDSAVRHVLLRQVSHFAACALTAGEPLYGGSGGKDLHWQGDVVAGICGGLCWEEAALCSARSGCRKVCWGKCSGC